MSISDAQILAFARRVRPSSNCTALEARVVDFLKSGPHAESVDELIYGRTVETNISDYLIDDRRLIVELKAVSGDSAGRVAALFREALDQEPRMFAVGRMSIQPILRARANGEEINSRLVHIAGRAVRQLLQKANKQILATRDHFEIPNAAGLVVLAVERGKATEAGVIAYAVRHAIFSEKTPLTGIDYVWVTMENHTIRLPDGGLGYPEMLIWRRAHRPQRLEALVGNMLDAWSSQQGDELVHVDHTQGWDSLSPAETCWRNDLDIYGPSFNRSETGPSPQSGKTRISPTTSS
ncbi:MAG: hypothetical protein EOP62_23495 [Sphingomonadales bacterium]|nr:MAG: hypothetical protein EOP62_23495 [Sphingomonadales bacterium]